MASIPDEDRGEFVVVLCVWGRVPVPCVLCWSIDSPILQSPQIDVEFDPQAVSIIRQNWIDKQLKKR